MWWWILWHLWHEHEHITVRMADDFGGCVACSYVMYVYVHLKGEFEYPDTSKWSNAELGIPADHPK